MTDAFVTLATSDEYALGAMVLAKSLRRSGTRAELAVMITDGVTDTMREILMQTFNHVEIVNVLDSQDATNLALLARPDLGVTFTKLHCWRLTQFRKAVFMDADTLVLQNIDDLFEREELSAAPDPGWPDCFNSGVFVFQPNLDTYTRLLQFALEVGSFDGGDQGLLNMFFSDWATKDIRRHLPFTYNCVSQSFYSYAPAFAHFRKNIKVIHFIGPVKPWHLRLDQSTGRVQVNEYDGQNFDHIQSWWSVFVSDVKPMLSSTMTGICGQMASMDISSFSFSSDGNFRPRNQQQAWEHGIIDYRGEDRFENIQRHLDIKIGGKKE